MPKPKGEKAERPLLSGARPSFHMTASSVFHLSAEQITSVFKLFQESGYSFSYRRVREAIKTSVDESRNIRRGVLELTEEISRHGKHRDKVAKELEEQGYPKEKIEAVISLALGTGSTDLKICKDLLIIDSYTAGLPHLEDIAYEVHHSMTDVKNGIMFPLVELSIATHGVEEPREVTFTLDANEFQHLVDTMIDVLEMVRKESEIVKKGMKSGFTSLIDK